MAKAKTNPKIESFARLSEKEIVILDLLSETGEMYGLELVGASDGRLKRGTVYVTLGRMEAKGLVASREGARVPAASGLPRPRYRPTALALRALKMHRALARLIESEAT